MSDDRYEVITWRGRKFDRWTVAALTEVERLLGFELDYLQGSLSTSVSASGSTHAGLGAGDCAPTSMPTRVVRVLRSVGFAAWHRLPLYRNGKRVWGEHIHFILVGDAKASPAALQQVIDYRNGLDGLAGRGTDSTWRPNPIPTFTYMEADMPYTDWPKADKDALVADVAAAVMKQKVNVTERDGTKNARNVDGILQALYNDAAKS